MDQATTRNLLKSIKALSNDTRLQILTWLKDPFSHFPKEELGPETKTFGVCVSDIANKAGLSIPTVSDYLKILQDCDLVISTRKGQWTYFKRNEKAIQQLGRIIKNDL
jgi:ArsR family transcriptional regulator